MATFGNTTFNGNIEQPIDNNFWGGVFTLSETGSAQSITMSMTVDGGTRPCKCAIYRASDSSLVGVSEEVDSPGSTFPTPENVTFNFSPTISLTADDYVLCCWATNAAGAAYIMKTAAGGTSKNQVVAYGSFPDPATFTDGSDLLDIFCTYNTPATAPALSGLFVGNARQGRKERVFKKKSLSEDELEKHLDNPAIRWGN